MFKSLLFLLSSLAFAQVPNPQLVDVGVTEQLGNKISLETPFVDDRGQAVKLKDYVQGNRPIVLMMGYY